MQEEFRKIQGYDNYSVSNFGNVRNDNTRKLLKNRKCTNEYYYITLCHESKAKNHLIHRLVAIAFIPNPENKKCVDHIDNNIFNNNVLNLRWATQQQNTRNSKLNSNNTSGVKGVSWDKKSKKWFAQIKINRINKRIGYFDNFEDAKQARQNEANKLFGDYTNVCEKVINVNVNINIHINQDKSEIEALEKELEEIINR